MLIETSTGKKKVINGQRYYFADIYRYLKDKLSERQVIWNNVFLWNFSIYLYIDKKR